MKINIIEIASGKSWWSIPFHLTLIAIVGFLYLNYFFNSKLTDITKHGEVITVPNLENLTVEEAQAILEENKLRYEISDTVFSEKHNMEAIVSQLPAYGSEVKENRRIYLTVNSSNRPKVKITETNILKIKKADIRQVQIDILSLGLKINKIDTIDSPYKGYVLEAYRGSKTIEVGDILYLGDGIRIEVGNGLGIDSTNIPFDTIN